MAFGGFNKQGVASPMAEINMIPLIDVMLVLLVVFIVCAPLLTHAVKIDLPKASSSPNINKPDTVQLGIKADGRLYWNGDAVDEAGLEKRFAATAKVEPQPEVHIRAEGATQYERVARVMSAAARSGLMKFGFVTDPAEK